MKILFLGDIVGRSGREAVKKYLPQLQKRLKPDTIIVNGENSAHGFGISEIIATDLFAQGVDVITTGNHVWDQKDILTYIAKEPRLLRPMNYPPTSPGRGIYRHTTSNGEHIVVMHAMARLFMDPLDDPFRFLDEALAYYKLGETVQAIFVDFHGEASSEKQAMAYFLDGRVTAVIGTHTHVPTADARILPFGTAYQTDAGMCGDYNSVIGMNHAVPVERFTKKMSSARLSPAEGEGSVAGVFIETNPEGRAASIKAVRLGPHLAEASGL